LPVVTLLVSSHPRLAVDVIGLAGSVLLLAIVWVIGSAIAPRRPQAERLAAGICGLLLLAWATMAQPIVGVSLLGHPRLALLAVLVGLVALGLHARRALLEVRIRWMPLAAGLVPAAIVSWPLVRAPLGSPVFPDMRFHEGWIRQLLGGVNAPGGTYADTPNDYPWLYHSLAAWLGVLLPGGMSEMLWALQAFTVLALGVGTWLLARELGAGEAAAAWAVLLAEGAGGVGWLWVHRAVVYTSSGVSAAYHGDFTATSALTPAMGDLAPVMPRDLAIALTPLALWLFLRAVTSRSRMVAAAGGAMVAAVILTGPVAGLVAAAIALALVLVYGAPRRQVVAWAGAAGAVTAAVWMGPFVWHYFELGGLGSAHGRPSASATEAVVGMGVLLPLGIAGAVIAFRGRRVPTTRALLAIVGVPLTLCTVAAALNGHAILGVAPVSRVQRYLPLLAVCLAPPAGMAASRLVRLAGPAWLAAAVLLVAAAGASTVLASVGLANRFQISSTVQFTCNNPTLIKPGQTVAVAGLQTKRSKEVSDAVFRWTGATTLYRVPLVHERFKNIFDKIPTQEQRADWIAAIDSGQPAPDGVAWVVIAHKLPAGAPSPVGHCTYVSQFGGIVELRLLPPSGT
jgi:hypothetical protein